MGWIKVSERLPLHKAHWNTSSMGAHDNDFPVRKNGRYAMGNIYDERQLHDIDPKYTINFEGKEYFENEFDEIEWLDESEPDQNQDRMWGEVSIQLNDLNLEGDGRRKVVMDWLKNKYTLIPK